jgi:hypothetical protein
MAAAKVAVFIERPTNGRNSAVIGFTAEFLSFLIGMFWQI